MCDEVVTESYFPAVTETVLFSLFASCCMEYVVSMEVEAGRERESNRPLLCALPVSAIHHQVERLFTAGVNVPDTCSLRWAIVVNAHPVHAKATLKIISSWAPLPWGQKEPILTRFIRPATRTFKTYLEFQDKTSTTLVDLSSVAISLLDPYLFFYVHVNLIVFVLWFALRHTELNITSYFHGHFI